MPDFKRDGYPEAKEIPAICGFFEIHRSLKSTDPQRSTAFGGFQTTAEMRPGSVLRLSDALNPLYPATEAGSISRTAESLSVFQGIPAIHR